jgi:hypothetical protein
MLNSSHQPTKAKTMSYTIPQRLLLQSVADEKVILDPDSGNYYTLDAIGARMIDLFRDSGSLEQTVARIVIEYEVQAETAHSDLIALLDQMVQQGLVQKTGN